MSNQTLAFERVKLILDMLLESCYRPAKYLAVVGGVAQPCHKIALAVDPPEHNFLLAGRLKIVRERPLVDRVLECEPSVMKEHSID
jgi:hypothetical protein